MSNFQPLEIVDRGSETQARVVENLNKLRIRANMIQTGITFICLHKYK